MCVGEGWQVCVLAVFSHLCGANSGCHTCVAKWISALTRQAWGREFESPTPHKTPSRGMVSYNVIAWEAETRDHLSRLARQSSHISKLRVQVRDPASTQEVEYNWGSHLTSTLGKHTQRKGWVWKIIKFEAKLHKQNCLYSKRYSPCLWTILPILNWCSNLQCENVSSADVNNLKRQAKPHGTVCGRSQSTDPRPKITQRLLGNTAFPDKLCVMKVPYLILFLLTEVNQQGACV